MSKKNVASRIVSIGLGVTLLASGLAFVSISPAPHSAPTARISNDRAAGSFAIAQRSRSSGNSPYNSFDNTSGGWMDGANTG